MDILSDAEKLSYLNRTLAQAKKSPFYAERLKDEPYKLKVLEDIEKLPFTTKQDLRGCYPFGTLAVPFDQVIETHTSSGTTGKPTLSFYTKRDISIGSKAIAEAWKTFGIKAKSRVQFIMSYGLFSGAMLNTYALQEAGAFVLPAGIQPSSKQLELMKDFEIDTLVATPGYYLHLYDYALEHGFDLKTLHLKRGVAAGEVYSDRIREDIEQKFNITVYDHYGLCEVNTGIAYECGYRNGMHILDDYVAAEVINPKTGEHAKPNEDGELVLTSLRKEASPIIRYRTGDMTSVLTGECPCGRSSMRIARIRGRIDDLLFIKGIKVSPHELKELVLEFAQNRIYSDIKIVTQPNDISHTPKLLITLKDVKDNDMVMSLQKLLRETTYLNFAVEHVGLEHFNREANTKVKLVEYVTV